MFSLVEEQRGRHCGKVTTLYMKVTILYLKASMTHDVCRSFSEIIRLSSQSPGASASEIFAKLEVYLWLGLAKYSKEATNCLPEEFLPVYEEEEEQRRLVPAGKRKLPVNLSCQGESADLLQQDEDESSGLPVCH